MLMSSTAKTRHDQAAERPIAALPFAVNMWSPFLACCTEWNARAHDGIATLSTQWQDFVSRRIKEDFALLRRVGASRSPEEVWEAYIAFWQKAAEDYAQEAASAAELAGGLMNRSIGGMQRRMQEATTAILPLVKAA
jgi:hypothetical protein